MKILRHFVCFLMIRVMNDSFSTSDYIASNCFWLTEENYMYKDFY